MLFIHTVCYYDVQLQKEFLFEPHSVCFVTVWGGGLIEEQLSFTFFPVLRPEGYDFMHWGGVPKID